MKTDAPTARSPALRTDADRDRLEALLAEAEALRGESLWRDAWRRLRADGPAWWSLVFLASVALTAFLVPLLPLPSPIALALAEEPQPPVPPWRSLGDRQWDHRIVVEVNVTSPRGMPLALNDDAREQCEIVLAEAVRRSTGSRPQLTWTGADSSWTLKLAVPFDAALLASPEGVRLDDRLATLLTTSVAPEGQLMLTGGKQLGLDVVRVVPRNGYWELGALDQALLALRYRLFGFAQAGPWLGTDAKGRDLLARIIWGSRVSLQVALAAGLCSLLIGVTYGAVAGWAGGRVDRWMMRFVDVLYSVPFIFVVIFLITLVGEYRAELANVGIDTLTVFYLVVGAIYWLTMARVVRGQVLQLRGEEFIEAARVLGASSARIVFVHLVPNVLSVVIVYLTLTIPAVMLFEAFLSFLGLGIEAPKVSWGLLAVDSTEALQPLKPYWWLVAGPASAMGSTLLALGILGDGLRDALDPKLRGRI